MGATRTKRARWRVGAAPRVALVVDNPQRDLPGLVLVARKLCREGVTVFLVPMNLCHNDLWPLVPDFVLLNHCRSTYEAFINRLYGAGISIGVLDNEGGVFTTVIDEIKADEDECAGSAPGKEGVQHPYELSLTQELSVRSKIARFFSWSEDLADLARKYDWYPADAISVSGTPRSDLYAARWRSMALEISGGGNLSSGSMVLLVGNFTMANPRFKTREEEVEMLSDRFRFKKAWLESYAENQASALDAFVDLANTLAELYPGVTFIYRPHPFENDAPYEGRFSDLPNLHLVREGTLDGWLMRSRALIHWGSSCAVDAALVGVPSYSVRWAGDPPPIPAVDGVSIIVRRQSELLAHLSELFDKPALHVSSPSENASDIIESVYYRVDGLSHERIASAILDELSSRKHEVSLSACAAMTKIPSVPGSAKKTLRGVKKILGIPPDWSFRERRRVQWKIDWDDSGKCFDAVEVQEMLNAAEKSAVCAGERPGAHLRALSPQEHHGFEFGYYAGRSVAVIT